MSTIPGITITSEITDHHALGRYIAGHGSFEQADLIGGLAVAIEATQVEYISEAIEAHADQAAIRWLITELYARLYEDGATA